MTRLRMAPVVFSVWRNRRTGLFNIPWIVTVVGFMLLAGETAEAQVLNKFRADLRGLGRTVVRKSPRAERDNSVEALAREIDWLEAHIDKYGSVVAKQPDVWGESRLTRFRSEYEAEMLKQLDQFKVRDNAAVIRSDLAFLANATGLGLALDESSQAPTINANLDTNLSLPAPAGSDPASAPEDSSEREAEMVNQTITINNSLPPRSPASDLTISLTDELNQRSRFISHLQQLRRINSGDDTSDAPGYSLNLVRIPVSITPGRETRRGYGAEVTVTARPYLSNALLPETFHDLVVNDMTDQLGLPLLKLADNPLLDFYSQTQQYRRSYAAVFPRLQDATRLTNSGFATAGIDPRLLPELQEGRIVAALLKFVFGHDLLVLNLGEMQTMGDAASTVLQVYIEGLKEKRRHRSGACNRGPHRGNQENCLPDQGGGVS